MAAVDETPVAVELATEAPQAEQAPSAMEVSEKSACEVAPAPTEQQAEAPEEKSGEPEAAPEAAPEERATDTMAVDAPAVTEEAAKEDASKEEAPEAAPKTEVQADAEPKAMEVEEDSRSFERFTRKFQLVATQTCSLPISHIMLEEEGVALLQSRVDWPL